jgi:hypothetical protein
MRTVRSLFAIALAIALHVAVAGTEKDVRFSGKVTDGLGRPLVGRRVTVEDYRQVPPDRVIVNVRTDADGRFSFALARGLFAGAAEDRLTCLVANDDGPSPALTLSVEGRDLSVVLRRRISLDDVKKLAGLQGKELDAALAEILSGDWSRSSPVHFELFALDDKLKASLQTLTKDPRVADEATSLLRDWNPEEFGDRPSSLWEGVKEASLEKGIIAAQDVIRSREQKGGGGGVVRAVRQAQNAKGTRAVVIVQCVEKSGERSWMLLLGRRDDSWHVLAARLVSMGDRPLDF